MLVALIKSLFELPALPCCLLLPPRDKMHRCGRPNGEPAGNGLRANISKAIEKDALSWTEPEAARFAPLETKAVQRPHSGLRSVSAVRMVRPRPFETTRKFALSGGAVGVCDGKMAVRRGFELAVWRQFWVSWLPRPNGISQP